MLFFNLLGELLFEPHFPLVISVAVEETPAGGSVVDNGTVVVVFGDAGLGGAGRGLGMVRWSGDGAWGMGVACKLLTLLPIIV